MSILGIHIKMIRRNGLRDYFATLRFCIDFFEWKTAIRLPIYVTHLVQYVKPKDKHRIILESSGIETQPAQLLIGFMDRQYSWDCPSFVNIQGTLRLSGIGVRHFAPGLSLTITEHGEVVIGEQFTCSKNLRLFVQQKVSIGKDNMWSYDCVVLDSDGHQIYDANENLLNPCKETIFGNHVWLGARNLVLKGSEFPDGSVCGAGQVLRKSYMEYAAPIIAGGNVIKENVKWFRPVK